MDASELTKRNRDRMVYANYLQQKTLVDNGLLIRITTEGGSGGHNEESAKTQIVEGTAFTSYAEQQAILNNIVIPTTAAPAPPDPNAPQAIKILLLGDGNVSTVATKISNSLTAAGWTFTLDSAQLSTTYTGSAINTTSYTVVIMYTNAGHIGAAALVGNLRAFVNAGGNLITGVFIGNLNPTGMDFTLTTFDGPVGQSNNATGNLTNAVTHPITTGITTLSATVFTNTFTTLQTGATLLSTYTSDGTPFLGINTVGNARLVTINAWLNDNSTNLVRIIRNSILWVTRNIS